MPRAPVAQPSHRGTGGEQAEDRAHQQRMGDEFGIGHQQQAGEHGQYVQQGHAVVHALAEV